MKRGESPADPLAATMRHVFVALMAVGMVLAALPVDAPMTPPASPVLPRASASDTAAVVADHGPRLARSAMSVGQDPRVVTRHTRSRPAPSPTRSSGFLRAPVVLAEQHVIPMAQAALQELPRLVQFVATSRSFTGPVSARQDGPPPQAP